MQSLTARILQLDEEQLALKALYSFILQQLVTGSDKVGWLQVGKQQMVLSNDA